MPFVNNLNASKFPNMPARIARLPVDHRGFPVPWFVAWIDGKPDHRVADTKKMVPAVKQNRCWICGDTLGRHKAFVIGPMCAVTLTAGEPPSHRDCAQFAAQTCPFMSIPQKRRRDNNLPGDGACFSENGLRRNPGIALIWITDGYDTLKDPGGNGWLFKIHEPSELLWFYEGRPASRAEVVAAVLDGLNVLRPIAEAEGPRAMQYFEARVKQTMLLVAQSTNDGA